MDETLPSTPPTTPTPPSTPSPTPSPQRTARHARWWLAATAVPLAALALALGAPWALVRSEAGTAWLLQQVPGLTVQGPRGALAGGDFSADRLKWTGTAGQLELQGLSLRGLRWAWRPAPGAWLGLTMTQAEVKTLRWQSQPSTAPATLPTSLRLPLQLTAPLRIDQAQIDTLAPLRGMQARLEIGADEGRRHTVQDLALEWDRLQASGRLQIAADAPFSVDAALQAQSLPGVAQPWQAQARLTGPLATLSLQGQLRGLQDAAVLDIDAGLAPLAAWPLQRLNARTAQLDLARLSSTWPQTVISGQATLQSSGRDAPFEARLALRNTAPGRWNEGRLPLQAAELSVRALLAAPDRLTIERLDLQFADAAGPAGRWRGQGRWEAHALTLDSVLEAVRPQRLDGRAAPMQIGGTLQTRLDGLPSPDPQATGTVPPWQVALQAQLEGRLDAQPVPVQLVLDLLAQRDRLELKSLQARTGAAEARGRATLKRDGPDWTLDTEGRLADFDPLPWWPGAEGSVWRRGPHRLNADWQLALRLPEAQRRQPDAWHAIDGQGQAQIEPSVLAGVPVQGRLAVAPGGRLTARLEVAGNELSAEGAADLRPGSSANAEGSGDRWQARLRAPALAALAPLAALHPALAAWAPQAGSAEADLRLQGRWPDLQGQGTAQVQGLQAGALSLTQGQLRWQSGVMAMTGLAGPSGNPGSRPDTSTSTSTSTPTSTPTSPPANDPPPPGSLQGQLTLSGLRWGSTQVPSLQATLEGSWAAHRLRAEAALPVVPPAILEQTLGLRLGRGTRVSLQGEGQLQRDAAGLRWSGRLAQLTAGAWDGVLPLTGAAPRDWLDTAPVRAEIALDADGSLQRLRADAGRLRLAGDIAVAWDEIRIDPGQMQVRARMESVRVAPLLARWQPGLGWEGDLALGARIDIQAGERFQAELVLEREGGDLAVRDSGNNLLALGLTDLRLGITAQDGTWYFTQALAGKSLGELGGALRVSTTPGRRWPEPEAPLDGSIQARVANLGVWGAWVPPGWRLEGALETTGTFGGRFGAPQVSGRLSGQRLGVRNLLQGVAVTGGEVQVRLEGERASIERFQFNAGSGSLTLTGGADLGARPRAQIAMTAERFQVLGRVDRRVIASGRADLVLAPNDLSLQGALKVDEGLFDASRRDAPGLDDDVNVRRPDTPVREEPESTGPRQTRRTDVNLAIDLGRQLRVRGHGLDTLLTGQLRVTAPGGKLAVNGTVNTEQGTFAAYGQKMEIERGVVAFSGAADNPRLDVLALRPNLDIEVGVAITGTAQSPRVRLHSNPELSDTDKLSWLVLGRDPSGLGRTDTALLQRAAVALLAGEGEAPTDTLIRSLGLDEVSVRQSDGEVSETIVSLGKQLSRRWYVGYERGVNSTVGTWQLIYRAAQRFTLRAQSGAENSIDLIWVWRVP